MTADLTPPSLEDLMSAYNELVDEIRNQEKMLAMRTMALKMALTVLQNASIVQDVDQRQLWLALAKSTVDTCQKALQ